MYLTTCHGSRVTLVGATLTTAITPEKKDDTQNHLKKKTGFSTLYLTTSCEFRKKSTVTRFQFEDGAFFGVDMVLFFCKPQKSQSKKKLQMFRIINSLHD